MVVGVLCGKTQAVSQLINRIVVQSKNNGLWLVNLLSARLRALATIVE